MTCISLEIWIHKAFKMKGYYDICLNTIRLFNDSQSCGANIGKELFVEKVCSVDGTICNYI